METRQPMPGVDAATRPYYLGQTGGIAYYFYYEKERATSLDADFLSRMDVPAEGYIIYADQCAFSEGELKKYNITFRKIPRDIKKL
jgi:adenine-specific DNA-methyltransferase